MRVAVVDYGMGNVDSAARALEVCGAVPLVTADPAELADATHLLLPGVGAFPDAMKALTDRGLVEPLRAHAAAGTPLLGVCLGMQLLAVRSFEGGLTAGLGLVDAEVVRLQPAAGERVPHVGWNELEPARAHPVLDGVAAGTDVYFVHSFQVVCHDEDAVLARTPHAGGFTSAVVGRGAVVGVQFHPEKSQRAGLGILRNFLAMRRAAPEPVLVGASC